MQRARLAALVLIGLGFAARAHADEPEAEALRFFEAKVRPVLVARCLKCHGEAKQKGGLRLDSLAAMLAGGDSGPAVVPGTLDESLIVEAINYDGLKMPPDGQLNADEREALARWVALGAPWPAADRDGPAAVARPKLADAPPLWSFQPLGQFAVPDGEGAGESRNPIDRFVARRLTAEGLAPSAEADRRTLIRRLTFDLHGLPPTPEEVDAFLKDHRPDAYERLVDRLLSSPRYGERWARHWLDLVRYADSDGYRQDAYRPDAWRYRDYVVRSLNEDKPYDRFVREQLAGDEVDPDDPELRVAVGFLRLGTYEYNQRDVPGQWATILNDITDVTGDVFLGLGLGCARCHDHKFDPIPQKDYYRLQAFFAPLRPRDDLPLATEAERADHAVASAAWDLRTADLREELAALERPYRERAERDALAKFPPETQALIARPAAERSPLEQQLVELAWRQVTYEWDHIGDKIKGKDKDLRDALLKRIAAFHPIRPRPLPEVLTATDIGVEAPPTVIPGDRSGRVIEPGFLTGLDPAPARVEPSARGTGRRSALAAWLTRPDHPLTTRVIVNRIWQNHFGRGLVATTSDFGRLGDRPSHPELLDWLARRFVADGWSLKALHRLILTSSTYRQSSHIYPRPEIRHPQSIDPENRTLWRMNARRLEVEPIRDAMLAVSGELDAAVGGPGVDVNKPRRTLYTKVMRNSRDPLVDAFDAPDGSLTTPARNVTTTPVQALLMLNGDWTLARARAFAGRLRREAADADGRVERAYRLAFGRPPDDGERQAAASFLESQAGLERADADAALVDFCHALLNSNESLYVD